MFGATFLNNLNRIQFDEKTPCMTLVKKGRFNGGGGVVSYSPYYSPILAIRPSNGADAYIDAQKVNGAPTFGIQTFPDFPSGGYVDYWLFDRPSPTPKSSGFGMELYDANGNVTYSYVSGSSTSDTLGAPMTIAGFDVGTYPAGRTYAFAAIGYNWSHSEDVIYDSLGQATGAVIIKDNYGGFNVTDNSVNNGASRPTSGLPVAGSGDTSGGPLTFLVIDVTGL